MISTLVTTVLTATLATSPPNLPRLPASVPLDEIRMVTVQHDGRWPPLDTVARDLVNAVTGDESFAGHDAVALLLAWTFDSPTWRQAPLFSISNAELRRELQLPADKTVFSFAELTSHKPLHALVDEVAAASDDAKLDPLQQKASDIHSKLLKLQSVFTGKAIKFVPHPTDPLGAWQALPASTFGQTPDTTDLGQLWGTVGKSYLADDAQVFSTAVKSLRQELASLPAAYRPSSALIATEIRYNKLQPFRVAWQIMWVGALLSLIAVFAKKRWFNVLSILGLIAGFAVLTWGLSMRWQIAGRIPASNMFESLLFLSWGAGASAIISMIVLRHKTVPLTASALGAIALMLADLLPMNHFIRPIPPVLMDTVWMSIHVPIIMVSYSVLALGVLVAHVQLVTMAIAPQKKKLSASIDTMHYWYIHVGSILLLAGIATGSMWAASSWGRYWGWDPKEVWSLVALLGYLVILHVRIDAERIPRWVYAAGATFTVTAFVIIATKLAPISFLVSLGLLGSFVALAVFVLATGPFATAFKSILAFWLIVMTYVGVNYVLGAGLHSYGFGTGAVGRYTLLVGTVDLGFALLCTATYLLRRRSNPSVVFLGSRSVQTIERP